MCKGVFGGFSDMLRGEWQEEEVKEGYVKGRKEKWKQWKKRRRKWRLREV